MRSRPIAELLEVAAAERGDVAVVFDATGWHLSPVVPPTWWVEATGPEVADLPPVMPPASRRHPPPCTPAQRLREGGA